MNKNIRFNLTPNQRQSYFELLVNTVLPHVKDTRVKKRIEEYAMEIFHEASHALMAYDLGVSVRSVQLNPQDGGAFMSTDLLLFDTPESQSLKEAKISLAGYIADSLFSKQNPDYPKQCILDGFSARLSLQYGYDFSVSAVKEFHRVSQGFRSVDQAKDMMRNAIKEITSRKYHPREEKPIRSKMQSIKILTQIAHDQAVWIVKNLDFILCLVNLWAQRRSKPSYSKYTGITAKQIQADFKKAMKLCKVKN